MNTLELRNNKGVLVESRAIGDGYSVKIIEHVPLPCPLEEGQKVGVILTPSTFDSWIRNDFMLNEVNTTIAVEKSERPGFDAYSIVLRIPYGETKIQNMTMARALLKRVGVSD